MSRACNVEFRREPKKSSEKSGDEPSAAGAKKRAANETTD